LSQGHSKSCDVVVVQIEDAFTPVGFSGAVDAYVETDQVPKTLDREDERSPDVDTGDVFDVQNFQGFLRLGEWCHASCGGSTVP